MYRFISGMVIAVAMVMGMASAVHAEAVLFQHGGHHYALVTEEMSWPNAEALCRKQGGYLVSINDEAENAFVRNIYKVGGVQFGWIGLSSDDSGAGQIWASGEQVAYRNFAAGDAQDNRSYFNINVHNGQWVGSNRIFNANRAFICESPRPLPKGGWGQDAAVIVKPRETTPPDRGFGSTTTTTTTPRRYEPKPEPKVDMEALAKAVESCVVMVEVEQGRSGITVSAPGVVLQGSQLVMVPSALLMEASKATLKVGEDVEAELEPVAVDGFNGLALLRVTADDKDKVAALKGLEIAETPSRGSVFAVIPTVSGKVRILPKTISGTQKQHDSKTGSDVTRLSFSERIAWEQAGYPIVTGGGELVGMTVFSTGFDPIALSSPTWEEQQPEDDQDMGMGMQFGGVVEVEPSNRLHEFEKPRVVYDAVAVSSSSPLISKKGETLSFSSAEKEADATKSAFLPQFISMKPRANARSVRLAALNVENRLLCPGCGGDGKVIREVKVGQEVRGGIKYDIVEKQEFTCEVSNGTGLAKSARIMQTTSDLAEKFARMNPKDRDTEKASEAVASCFQPMYHEIRWPAFGEGMVELALGTLKAKNLKVGDSFISVGRELNPRGFGLDPNQYAAFSLGMDGDVVILDKPLLKALQDAGKEATFGGVVIGWMVAPAGQQFPILGRGFALNYALR